MNIDRFDGWLAQLSDLSAGQRDKLRRALVGGNTMAQVAAILEEHGVSECPHCHAGHPVRYGTANGLQRFRCHACQRTFNALTGTPLAGLHKPGRWEAFAQTLREGLSVRKAADRCGIHRNTSQRWRHRFLALSATHQAPLMAGIAEADETFFRQSSKGSRALKRKAHKRGTPSAKRGRSDDQVCVLVARDRSGNTLSRVMPTFNCKTLKTVLQPHLAADAVLCSDGLPVYTAFAAATGITHEPVNLAQGIRVRNRVFHIQNVNAYDSRLKNWMRRFHGVATRYLPNYLGWFRLLDTGGSSLSPSDILHAAIGMPHQYYSVT